MKKEKVIFTNNSMVVGYYNTHSKDYVSEKIDSDFKEFNTLLDCEVEFHENLTVEAFLNHIKPFINEIQYILNPYIGKCDLKEFFDLMEKPNNNKIENHVDYVEMFWHCEIWETLNILNNKSESDFSIWGGYHGVPLNKEDIKLSFGLTPLNEWKHYKFKLNDNLICYKNSENSYHQLVFESTMKWKFFDVLKHFFYELTFYGSLSDIEEFKKSIEDYVHTDIDEAEQIDKLEIEYLEEELKELLENEEYEKAAIIQKEINELKKQLPDSE